MTALAPSKDCYDIIKEFESCRLAAYYDAGGIPTIGWGHTHGVTIGTTCTQEQADAWLEVDVAWAEAPILAHVHPDLNQHQYDSLVSFVFNVGPGVAGPKGRDGFVTLKNCQPSTMLRMLNAGNFIGAAGEFPKWNHGSGGVVLPGLTRRRLAEQSLFLRTPLE